MGQNGSKWVKTVKMGRNRVKMGQTSPFWTLLGPREPQKGRGGGTGQERPKGGQKAIQMCFGTVLYHLDAILLHFEPKLKIDIFSILRPFWAILGPFWALFGPFLGPFGASGALKGRGEPAKSGQKGVKRPYKCVLGPF